MLTVVAQNRVMSSTAAFADFFLPVMPPLVLQGGICGLLSTSNAAIRTQQGGICAFFSTSWIIGRLYKLQQTFLFRAVSYHFLLQLQFSDITIDKKHPYIGRSRCMMTSSGDILD
jgi:hypothetical protein